MYCSFHCISVCFLAIIGWFISFVCLLISHNNIIQPISWYVIGFEFLLVSFSCTVLWTDTTKIYFPIILTLAATSLSYLVKEIDLYFTLKTPTSIAIGSGYVLLMITQIIWIFQFGMQPQESNESSRIYVSPYRNRQLTYDNNYPEMHSLTQDTVYLSPHAYYSIPVTAIHNYEGNKTDPNELSFSKGEVMFVYEKIGNWWQAKKSNGEIGVIPSNYVRL